MDEVRREFQWYVQGCHNLGLEPRLERSLFLLHYDRFLRLSEAIQRYEERRKRRISRRKGSQYQDDVFLARLMQNIRAEQAKLEPLALAVGIGQALENGEEGEGGVGVPACRHPDLPVLVGTGAKLPPHLDPEPWARDP